jgi:MYXO-CTERM domain-containing protein
MWTAGPTSPIGSGDENAWASLQNGGVLAVAPMGAAIYDPVANKWTKTGALPSGFATTLTGTYAGTYDFGDTAGISQMFDGRVIAYGLGKTAIYTPGATASDPGTWALGPNLLFKTGPNNGTAGDDAEDEYTVTEPNGKVMIATYPFGASPDLLQEFDPTTNSWSEITPPADASGPYPVSYLNLPNGQVMVTCGSRDWLYTPDSQPQDAWRPTVTSVTYDSTSSTYTLTGTQISGLINGGDEGDDMTMAENYPIVFLKDTSGNVYFCKSLNFSNMMPSKGDTPETCQFTTPAGLPQGTYDLYVSAVGVQSKDPVAFTVGVGGMGTPSDAGAGGADGGGTTASTGGSSSGGTTSGSASSSGNGSGATGAPGASSGGATGSSGGGSTAGTSSSANGTAGATESPSSQSPGCGCRTVPTPTPWRAAVVALFALAGAALWRRLRVRNAGDLGRE